MSDFQSVAFEYNKNRDYNCAESVLLISSELYGFSVTAEELHLVSGFGAGMGCGNTCGAIAGALAVLGRLSVTERAHTTEGFKQLCSGLTKAMETRFEATECRSIMPRFRSPEFGCSTTIATAMDVLDSYLKEHDLV